MQLAFITSRLRVEEKLLLAALDQIGVRYQRFDDAQVLLNLGGGQTPDQLLDCKLVWNRSLSFGRTLYMTGALESLGLPSVNSSRVVATAGDKAQTSMALEAAGIPQPKSIVAFTPESALAAVEQLGYPAVLKPVVGSWGRQVARVDDQNAAEALLETRAALGGWQSGVFYVQEYIEKPGRDLRVFVSGTETLAAIARNSEHWVTNTARGATVEGIEVTSELRDLALSAAEAIAGQDSFCQVAVDIVEAPDGLKVLEINHSSEFRNSSEPTGVDLAAELASSVAAQLSRLDTNQSSRNAACAPCPQLVQ